MATNAAGNRRTFSLQTPADLYLKLHHEALALHNDPPADLTLRAYAVMNAITTAWQMKDWVYEALRAANQLEKLDEIAARPIKNREDFGTFLTGNSPWMSMCFQLATAAKHFEVYANAGPEVVTRVDFEIEPGAIGSDIAAREEIMVATHLNSISGPGLVLLMDYIWADLLHKLELLDRTE